MASDIRPFRISIPDSRITILKEKLALATFPDELEDSGWDYGAPLLDIKRLTSYWKDKFDWRAQEARLNELPHFRTAVPVDGFGDVDIHFVHVKSKAENAIPLLFVHGWPGCFLEATKLISLLAKPDPTAPAFSIVVPSLPNYGFSASVKKRGFGLAQYAETFNKLMLKLGYTEYVTQGGDWGCMITRTMGLVYPEHVKASHLNMIRSKPPKFSTNPLLAIQHSLNLYSERDKKGFERTKWFQTEGKGYRDIQATKPQTPGYALADSPVALLAWIYEKLHDWTDEYPWTEDEILTWISIYWFSEAGPAASLRIYYESVHTTNIPRSRTEEWIGDVKLGLAYFPKELGIIPKTWGRMLGDVVFESEYDHGGHFAAWERPEDIESDLEVMFGKGGGAFGVVKGKSGY